MIVMINNYDSFVYNLVHYLKVLEEEIVIFKNDEVTLEDIKKINPIGIVLSPGPKTPKESGLCLDIIEEFKEKIPILGVCLGHQAIAYQCGLHIIKGKEPIHGKISKITHINEGIFKGLEESFHVTRYHSLIVEDENTDDFIITARSEDDVIMGIKHRKYLLEGVQFHPEAVLTENGHKLLENYIKWCKDVSKRDKDR